MKQIDILKELAEEEHDKIFDEEICPKCQDKLKTNYYDPDGCSFVCHTCDIEYWSVY